MKGKIFIFLVVMLLFSCKKENDEKFPANPDWLTEKISEMATSTNYIGANVCLYKWDNEYYYLISNPVSNCMYCDFYDYQGIKFEWTPAKIDDFQKNAKRIKVVWSDERLRI